MTTITGRVETPHGGRYVRQLCKHWSHKLEVESEGDRGVVRFPDATAVMDADEAGIALSLAGEDAARLEQLKGVIERHLDRFAFREAPLDYRWN